MPTFKVTRRWNAPHPMPVRKPKEKPQANQSKGLGDTVAKVTHATRLDKLAHLYTKITGKDCGCKNRQEWLNRIFPYESGQTS
jgi:hypothetical protein